eukprot:gnl/MRDRNA2_/MRDRNA2_83240_c0_seq1.p1 gnl/MRDRNA2_/MRDRNA2_83240_c0~~gnl/MRDRNA2_/MRDRNA2_83240_c0_seq1.p1  ORF type:complete len:935 (+),score=139.87 gnl/MRDRNA2_/MRDRNA2_83240_c0_seq1:217-2805(+)
MAAPVSVLQSPPSRPPTESSVPDPQSLHVEATLGQEVCTMQDIVGQSTQSPTVDPASDVKSAAQISECPSSSILVPLKADELTAQNPESRACMAPESIPLPALIDHPKADEWIDSCKANALSSRAEAEYQDTNTSADLYRDTDAMLEDAFRTAVLEDAILHPPQADALEDDLSNAPPLERSPTPIEEKWVGDVGMVSGDADAAGGGGFSDIQMTLESPEQDLRQITLLKGEKQSAKVTQVEDEIRQANADVSPLSISQPDVIDSKVEEVEIDERLYGRVQTLEERLNKLRAKTSALEQRAREINANSKSPLVGDSVSPAVSRVCPTAPVADPVETGLHQKIEFFEKIESEAENKRKARKYLFTPMEVDAQLACRNEDERKTFNQSSPEYSHSLPFSATRGLGDVGSRSGCDSNMAAIPPLRPGNPLGFVSDVWVPQPIEVPVTVVSSQEVGVSKVDATHPSYFPSAQPLASPRSSPKPSPRLGHSPRISLSPIPSLSPRVLEPGPPGSQFVAATPEFPVITPELPLNPVASPRGPQPAYVPTQMVCPVEPVGSPRIGNPVPVQSSPLGGVPNVVVACTVAPEPSVSPRVRQRSSSPAATTSPRLAPSRYAPSQIPYAPAPDPLPLYLGLGRSASAPQQFYLPIGSPRGSFGQTLAAAPSPSASHDNAVPPFPFPSRESSPPSVLHRTASPVQINSSPPPQLQAATSPRPQMLRQVSPTSLRQTSPPLEALQNRTISFGRQLSPRPEDIGAAATTRGSTWVPAAQTYNATVQARASSPSAVPGHISQAPALSQAPSFRMVTMPSRVPDRGGQPVPYTQGAPVMPSDQWGRAVAALPQNNVMGHFGKITSVGYPSAAAPMAVRR